jgi:hypothetical protein
VTTGRRLGALMVGVALVAMPTVALAQASGPDSALTLDRLAPGISRQGTVSVTNPSDQPVTVALATLDLSDDDNGCVLSETRDGDTTCGETGGELSQWLDVSIAEGGQQLWSGRLTELDKDRRLPGVLDPGETKNLDVTVALPFEAGNDTQTDRVSFDLRIRTIGVSGEDVGEPEVLGAQASAGHQSTHAISVPTLIDAGLIGPVVSAGHALTNDLPVAVFAVLLVLAIGVTVRVLRHGRR